MKAPRERGTRNSELPSVVSLPVEGVDALHVALEPTTFRNTLSPGPGVTLFVQLAASSHASVPAQPVQNLSSACEVPADKTYATVTASVRASPPVSNLCLSLDSSFSRRWIPDHRRPVLDSGTMPQHVLKSDARWFTRDVWGQTGTLKTVVSIVHMVWVPWSFPHETPRCEQEASHTE